MYYACHSFSAMWLIEKRSPAARGSRRPGRRRSGVEPAMQQAQLRDARRELEEAEGGAEETGAHL
jgi:hypothetical protein